MDGISNNRKYNRVHTTHVKKEEAKTKALYRKTALVKVTNRAWIGTSCQEEILTTLKNWKCTVPIKSTK